MNSRLQNQLNMVGACINVAQSPDYKPVWDGKEPADFGTDMAKLGTDYGAVTTKAAQADAATGGGGDAKAGAETVLEEAAFVLTRAMANHFRKTGDSSALTERPKNALARLERGNTCFPTPQRPRASPLLPDRPSARKK